MSVQAISWALSVEAGSPSAKCTLLCIANYADDHGHCWPSQATIAKQSEQSIDTIQRRIKDLESVGLLTRRERPDQNGKAGGRYFYQLSMEKVDQPQPLETTPQNAARSKTTPQIYENHTANGQKAHRTVAVQTTILEPSVIEPSKKDYWPSDYFGSFWEVYPRKVGKAAALKALSRIRKSGTVSWPQIISALDKFRAWAATKDIQFVKYPATWLNAGCWDDELTDGEYKNGFGGSRPLQDDSKSASLAAGRLIEKANRGEFQFSPRPSLHPPTRENDVQLLPKR